MNEREHVVHWSSDPDAPAGMRALLRAAEAADHGPTAAELANLRARLASQLPPAGAIRATGALSARSLRIGLLVVGAGVGLVLSLRSPGERPLGGVEVAEPGRPPLVAPLTPTPVAPIAPVTAIIPVAPITALPTPAPPVHPARTDTTTGVGQPRHRPPHEPIPPPATGIEAAAAPAPPLPPRTNATETAPAPQLSEVALLEQARAALRGGNTAEALTLTQQHVARYPDGVLVEEREALAIEGLMKLGRSDDARARWSKFATSYPRSNYHARLQRMMKARTTP